MVTIYATGTPLSVDFQSTPGSIHLQISFLLKQNKIRK